MLYALACLGRAGDNRPGSLLVLLPRFAGRGATPGRMLIALPGALLLLSLAGGVTIPLIHDITTDTADPPAFTGPEQRGDSANTLDIDPQAIARSSEAYPELQTLLTDMTIDEAFTARWQWQPGWAGISITRIATPA